MKKILVIMMGIVAISLISCSKASTETPDYLAGTSGALLKTFSAGVNEITDVRAALSGLSVIWTKADSIGILGGDGNVAKFVLQEDGTTFSGEIVPVEPGSKYYAAYPYTKNVNITGVTVSTTIPNEQKAVKNGFDPRALIATGSSEDGLFSMNVATALVKISVPSGLENVKSMTIVGLNGENVSGQVTINVDSEEVSATVNSKKYVTLTAASGFEEGDYYICVIPGAFETGMQVILNDMDGKHKVFKKTESVSLSSAVVTPFGKVPASIKWVNARYVRTDERLRTVLADAKETKDTVIVMTGTHTFDSNSSLPQSRVIIAETERDTKLIFEASKSLLVSSEQIGNIELHGFDIEAVDYLLKINQATSISKVVVDNCRISIGRTLIVNDGVASNVDNITVNDCIVYSGGKASYYVLLHASSGAFVPNSVNFSNSTISNTGRGLMICSNTGDYPYEISISNCTIYKLSCLNDGAYMVDIRSNGESKKTLSIQNSVVHYGGSKYCIFKCGGSPAPITVSGFYYFKNQEPTFGSKTYNFKDQMKDFDGNITDMWTNPQDDPTADGASFKMKNQTMSNIGDPRWND